MTVRAITTDIETSGAQFKSGAAEVAQTIRTRLKLFRGEYFRDITEGTPWFETILTKDISNSARDSAIKRVILKTDGVVSMIAYSAEVDRRTRKYTVACTVMTAFGVASVDLDDVIFKWVGDIMQWDDGDYLTWENGDIIGW